MCIAYAHTHTHTYTYTQVQESSSRDTETHNRDDRRASRVAAIHVWKLTASHSVTHLREYTEEDGEIMSGWVMRLQYLDARMNVKKYCKHR